MKFASNALLATIFAFALPSASMAAIEDLQKCTAVKIAKDRLTCFDRFAAELHSQGQANSLREREEAQAKVEQNRLVAETKASVMAEVDRMKIKLTESFKDPDSAQFRNVVAYGNANPLNIAAMCGAVNAKNSYGAYIGFKRFFLMGEYLEIESTKTASTIDRLWPTTCEGEEVYRQDAKPLNSGS